MAKKVPQTKITTNAGVTQPPEVDSKRRQPRRPKKPAEETSATGGFGSTAPETLNVAHVPYAGKGKRKKPQPAPVSVPTFVAGVPTGKVRKKRQKK